MTKGEVFVLVITKVCIYFHVCTLLIQYIFTEWYVKNLEMLQV